MKRFGVWERGPIGVAPVGVGPRVWGVGAEVLCGCEVKRGRGPRPVERVSTLLIPTVPTSPASGGFLLMVSVTPTLLCNFFRMNFIPSSKHFCLTSERLRTHGSTCKPEKENTSKNMKNACQKRKREP